MSSRHLAEELVKMLHAYLQENPESIAIALPRAQSGDDRRLGNVMRFFSDNPAPLEDLCGLVDARRSISELVVIGRVRDVPDNPGSWVAYTRFRIPSRKRQKKDTDTYYERRCRNRAEKAVKAQEIPSVFVTSSKNRDQEFALGIEIMHSANPDRSMVGKLNGYGLSSVSSPVWLPDLG